MARVTQPYKNTSSHRTRAMTTEASFDKGMRYTNAPLEEGYSKLMVNYRMKDDGNKLSPRGGMHTVADAIIDTDVGGLVGDLVQYNVGQMYINYPDNTEEICRYVIYGKYSSTGVTPIAIVCTVDDENYISAPLTQYGTQSWFNGMQFCTAQTISKMHGLTMHGAKAAQPVCATIDGSLYCTAHNATTGDALLLQHILSMDSNGDLTWNVHEIEPSEILPAQAINYGYNMLKGSSAYTFTDSVNTSHVVELLGVIPYAAGTNELKLSARPGTAIDFRLFYRWDPADVTGNDTYRVQWEVQDNDAGTEAVVVQAWEQSESYTPGDPIIFTYTPTVTNFSLIVRVYKQSDIDDQTDEWNDNIYLQQTCTLADFITPTQVTTLASYYLTSDSASTSLNSDAVTYDLCEATGMCSWLQRLVVWGVPKATSSIFVSEINQPSYFPYPNNTEIFKDEVIACVPYLSDLLVFTRSALYKCSMNEDGLTYTTSCVQDKLNMTAEDINTVVPVQNMIFFKSANYYYLVVPQYSYNAGTYGVQIAPVSKAVEDFLDYFEDSVHDVFNTVYNFTYSDVRDPMTCDLYEFNNYLDGNLVHNVYKFKVKDKYWLDLHLNYDTVLRAWSVYIVESTQATSQLYIESVTNAAVYATTYFLNNTPHWLLYKYDDMDPEDATPLGFQRTLQNRQYIDTGNRNFSEDVKKRFREVQFCVNMNSEEQLNFNCGFTVDDVPEVTTGHWDIEYTTDTDDPNYGDINIVYVQDDVQSTPELTELNFMHIETAQFPEVTMYKLRYHVCGKGYNGSVQILSDNLVPYELVHIIWVYRQMWGR